MASLLGGSGSVASLQHSIATAGAVAAALWHRGVSGSAWRRGGAWHHCSIQSLLSRWQRLCGIVASAALRDVAAARLDCCSTGWKRPRLNGRGALRSGPGFVHAPLSRATDGVVIRVRTHVRRTRRRCRRRSRGIQSARRPSAARARGGRPGGEARSSSPERRPRRAEGRREQLALRMAGGLWWGFVGWGEVGGGVSTSWEARAQPRRAIGELGGVVF